MNSKLFIVFCFVFIFSASLASADSIKLDSSAVPYGGELEFKIDSDLHGSYVYFYDYDNKNILTLQLNCEGVSDSKCDGPNSFSYRLKKETFEVGEEYKMSVYSYSAKEWMTSGFSVKISGETSSSECVDSDSGKDTFIRGIATGPYSEQKLTGFIFGENANKFSSWQDFSLSYSIFHDHCYGETIPNQLLESYCKNGVIEFEQVNCENGCRDGVCMQGNESMPVPLPVCGNGLGEDGEECDDGNLVNGDGCDSKCNKEAERIIIEENVSDKYYGNLTYLRKEILRDNCELMELESGNDTHNCDSYLGMYEMDGASDINAIVEVRRTEFDADNVVTSIVDTLEQQENLDEEIENTAYGTVQLLYKTRNDSTRYISLVIWASGNKIIALSIGNLEIGYSDELFEGLVLKYLIKYPSSLQMPSTCKDSDGGLNYYTNGIASRTGFESTKDFCANSTKLSEALCNNDGKPAYAQYDCLDRCADGVCKTNTTCIDYDGENYYNYSYIKEQATGWAQTLDTCVNSTTVEERVCVGGVGANKYFVCPKGCLSGACRKELVAKCGDGKISSGEECDDGNNINGDGCSILCKKEICYDSDGGIYLNIKGNVTFTPSCPACPTGAFCKPCFPTPRTYVDFCDAGTGLLKEFYCENKNFMQAAMKCSVGTMCSNGACVSALQISFATNKNNYNLSEMVKLIGGNK